MKRIIIFLSLNLILFQTICAQAPNISYSGVQSTYPLNTDMTPVNPINNGGVVTAIQTITTILASGIGANGLAVDNSGNIYVTDNGSNWLGLIHKINAKDGVITTLATGFYGPEGICIDNSGNIYVADNYNNAIKRISADGITITTIGSGFKNPTSVTVDASGNVYVADFNGIKRISAIGGIITSIYSGMSIWNLPIDITTDLSGNIYMADKSNSITRMNASGGNQIKIGALPSGSLVGVSIDNLGSIYVVDRGLNGTNGSNGITRMSSTGSNATSLGFGITNPIRIAVDKNYNIYVADNGIKKISLVNYTIKPALPTGLSFDSITGVISGKPIVMTVPTTYTITASNASGESSTTITFGTGSKPKISYSGVQATYSLNKTIEPLIITNTGEAPVKIQTLIKTLGNGFNMPTGVAVDNVGNIYISDYGNNAIKKMNSTGGNIIKITDPGSNVSSPFGISVDPVGNIYVADQGNNAVKCLGRANPLGSGFNRPSGVAIDGSYNIYVADQGNKSIKKMSSLGWNLVTLNSGFNQPTGIALDATGNIYVADYGSNAIFRINSTGGNLTNLGSGFSFPTGVAVDNLGYIYIADQGNNSVKRMDALGNNIINLGSGFIAPSGIALNSSGEIFVADAGNNAIKKITMVNYSIQPELPSGLSFDGNTGTISGSPTVATSLTSYTIIAGNSLGSSSTNISFATTINTAISEVQKIQLRIYPNPSKDLLRVESNEPIQLLEVVNLTGSKVISINPNVSTIHINVANLPTGTYILKTSTISGQVISKIIKD